MHDHNCKISLSDDIQQKFQIAARTHIAVDYYRRQVSYVLASVCLLRAIVSKVLKLALITPLVNEARPRLCQSTVLQADFQFIDSV